MDHDINERHDTARRTLHRVANHVLARAEHAENAHVGLRATPGGFSTTTIRPDRERIRISGTMLVRESVATTGTWTRAVAIDGSTLAELATFADVDLDAEFSAGHDTPPVGDIHERLELDALSAQHIADWYALTTQALDRVVQAAPAFSAPSMVQLWPEHFDAALDMAFDPDAPTEHRVNMGGSPGDEFHAAPYLYVGPWTPDRPGDAAFWNAPFGAVLGYHDVAASKDPVDAAVAFLRTGLERLAS
jgi:hypothetical protein